MSALPDIHFADPGWVHLLWPVFSIVGLLIWLELRRDGALDRFVSTALQARLVSGPSVTQRAARVGFLAAAGIFLTLAMMRPQWGYELVENRRVGAEIMVCLDVSRSMLAEDAAPNRLERAKAELRDLLILLDGDQVGLIAFAGRASVLSPLTPDFGFLRLALDNANPNSVSRGGTRLEEPIRKAIAGFGDAGEVSRSILLITDGEDHDSFPLEAAKAAAERGIKILAVGFGAETGTEIRVTDPKTGATSLLRDSDGAVVKSRLDGELLREMALATNGAYIPAGTGLLDLESIFRRHIAPLTRGRLQGASRTIRNDAFQWAVLLGLVSLLAAVMSTARASNGRAQSQFLSAVTAFICLLLGSLAPVQSPHAQNLTTPAGQASTVTSDAKTAEDQEPQVPVIGAAAPAEDASGEAIPVPKDPRQTYNDGLAKLDADEPQAALELLEAARANAGTDAQTRFRATYNLGWAEVKTADALLESNSTQALEHLHRAASWFREAVSLRTGHADARYNLEITMRRALELADSLASKDNVELRAELEKLMAEQRSFLTALRAGVAAEQARADANPGPELRRQFRGLAARLLTVLADAEALSERARRELDAITAKAEKDRSLEEAVRAARLDAVIGHLHQGRERIGQARSQLRKLQGERAYRRGAAALGAWQRARDQLLEPVARLDALLSDALQLAQLTGLKATLRSGLGNLGGTRDVNAAWLTPAYLSESQTTLEERTGELHREIAAGLAASSTGEVPLPQSSVDESNPQDAVQREKFIAAAGKAAPLLQTARDQFAAAAGALASEQLQEAIPTQRAGLEALAEAREYFLDLRRLIELVYREEQRVAAALAPQTDSTRSSQNTPAPEERPERIKEAMAFGQALHGRNIERAVRLSEALSDAMVEAQTAASAKNDASSGQGAAPASAPPDGRPEQGYDLLAQALDEMHSANKHLENAQSAPATALDEPLNSARDSVDAALVKLEALRRLFFNLLEHLRDTALRQQTLNDETEALSALSDGSGPEPVKRQAGPLQHRQKALSEFAGQLGEGLNSQADAAQHSGQPEQAGQPGPAAEDSAEMAERMRQAAALVTTASTDMTSAADRLGADEPILDTARESQDRALQGLTEAIALLQDQQQQSPDQQQQQPSEQESGEGQGDPKDNDSRQGQADMAQLLQGVRDREAQRAEERARNAGRAGYEPVEKDW